MLRTPLCDLVGIEVPVVQAGSAGLIRELRPATDIVQMLVSDAEAALAKAATLVP